MKILQLPLLLTLVFFQMTAFASPLPTSERAEQSISNVEPKLKKALASKGLTYGSPIFIRVFKEPGVLEVWVQDTHSDTFKHFKTYDICYFSGGLGPKVKEGDRQSPEGFYFVGPQQLNPWSKYHLSFNLGYPNAYDKAHQRTGSALMIHGSCVSIGCYAMTNKYIDEIYTLAHAALHAGQPFFRVHAFPFKLNAERLKKERSNKWYAFWLNLKEGYDYFNTHRRPPNVQVIKGQYVFGP